jgi:hypothetical protein
LKSSETEEMNKNLKMPKTIINVYRGHVLSEINFNFNIGVVEYAKML